jgi:hypothetical protein
VGFVDIFHKQIWSGVRGDQEFSYFPPLSHLKAKKIKCLTYTLIFVRKTIPPIYRNGGSIRRCLILVDGGSFFLTLHWDVATLKLNLSFMSFIRECPHHFCIGSPSAMPYTSFAISRRLPRRWTAFLNSLIRRVLWFVLWHLHHKVSRYIHCYD